ncbi:MAG: STAS domain-containing protein [Gammaproteobacteria bacterium]
MAGKVAIEDIGGGRFRVNGPLTFDTVAETAAASQKLFADYQALELDLSGVTTSDSAGLALLIEWVSRAQHGRCKLSYAGIPAQLLAIARISDVDKLLPLSS